MLLSVAFVPPPSVLEHVAMVLDSAGIPSSQLELIPADRLQISVAAFGNVANSEAANLARALTRESEAWPSGGRIVFSGGAALEFPGDVAVWVKATGDVETLEAIAQSISPAVKRLGFAVDRRRFRPALAIARVTASTKLPTLERVLELLDGYTSPEWMVDHLALVRTAFDAGSGGSQGFEVLKEFALP